MDLHSLFLMLPISLASDSIYVLIYELNQRYFDFSELIFVISG